MRRLFVAIEIPDDIKERISEAISSLRGRINGKFVAKENLHVTLLFLGNPALKDDAIIDAVKNQKLDANVELSGFGAFPDFDNARVLFIDVKTDLKAVYDSLCAKLGIEPERNFHPHVTVCRLYKHRLKPEDINSLPQINETFYADKLSLFNSDFQKYYKIY